MFSFHKPKVYRSTAGCCICKAKSSRYVKCLQKKNFYSNTQNYEIMKLNAIFAFNNTIKESNKLITLIICSFYFAVHDSQIQKNMKQISYSASNWKHHVVVKFVMLVFYL